MVVIVDSVQDDSEVGPEFGNDIEGSWIQMISTLNVGNLYQYFWYALFMSFFKTKYGAGKFLTPHETHDELYRRIDLMLEVQADRHSRLRDDDRPDVVQRADGRDLRPVEQLEDVHGDEELRADDEDVPHSDFAAVAIKRGVHRGLAKRDGHEWVRRRDEEDDLDGPRHVVVDEAPAHSLVRHGRVFLAVDPLHEEGLEDVEPDGEDDDEANDQDEPTVGRESRDLGVHDLVEMGMVMVAITAHRLAGCYPSFHLHQRQCRSRIVKRMRSSREFIVT